MSTLLNSVKNNKTSSINNFINDKIKNNSKIIKDDEFDIDKLEKEFELKSKSNNNFPKNYGSMWTNEERKIILDKMKKNKFSNDSNLFDVDAIKEISNCLERTEQGVKEEIKKMIYNDYIIGIDHKDLSLKYNVCIQNIKLLIKSYIEKNGKKIINAIGDENTILKLQIENIKLKKELRELNKN
jgi:hypothetical protein